MITTLALLMLATGPTVADEPSTDTTSPRRFVPTLALEGGMTDERLEIDLGGRSLEDRRSLWNTRVTLGLAYDLVGLGHPSIRLIGQTSVGAGLRWETGDWPVHIRQEVAVAFRVNSWFAVHLGVGTGVEVNTRRPEFSYWEVGLPITLRFARFELQYYPHATLPLGAEESAVFGGARRQSAAPAVVPVHIVLRFRIPEIGW